MQSKAVWRAIILIVAVLVIFVGLFFLFTYLGNKEDAENNSDSSSTTNPSGVEQSSSSEDPFQEIEDLEEDRLNILICGIDNTQMLTDVILLVSYQTKKDQVDVLQIPRDTFVGENYPTGKINAVYGHPVTDREGMEELRALVEHGLSIHIDNFVTITLEGFRNLVDALGGVEVDLDYTIEYLPGKVLYPGVQTLDGEKAEWLVRYRKGYAMGDIGRIDAQENFLMSLLKTIKKKGRIGTLSIVMQNFSEIDTDLSLGKVLSLANAVIKLEEENIDMHLLPGYGVMYNGLAIYSSDKEKLAELLNSYFRDADYSVSANQLKIPVVPQTAAAG